MNSTPKTLVQKYSEQAREMIEARNVAQWQVAQTRPEAGLAHPDRFPEAQYSYPCRADFGGLFFVVVDLSFFTDDRKQQVGHFQGKGGGLVVGGGVGWGTAWLNYPIEQLRGWEARFEANVSATVININLWGMSGENIGSCVTGGFGIGLGIVGGIGKFDR